ncbi:IS66 family transposase [Persicobacter psychrovividus]|uniref:Transposase n=1 Tax=Persicobacter psychrovividus TaxID=387638 RepID=A0ABN6L764_9BACT|nr:transposase [Persicobacter psychrovividus]
MLPKDLPTKDIYLKPKNLPENAQKIGAEVVEVLDYQPSKLIKLCFHRERYVIPLEDERFESFMADYPSKIPIPKGNVSASLLSYLLVSKFVDHLPIYRLIQMFKRDQIVISDSTINNWIKKSAELLEELYQLLTQKVQQSNYVQADETTIKLSKKGGAVKAYMWAYHAPCEKIACFQFNRGRGAVHAKKFFDDFTGKYIQVDGYAGYDYLENRKEVTLVACLAHIRRKFFDAQKNDKKRALYVLKEIGQIYEIERAFKEEQASVRQQKRKEQILPILMDLKEWIKENAIYTTPKQDLGKAFQYFLNMFDRMINYVEDGLLLPDNNLIENQIRPIAIGRKNYMFVGSESGGQWAAMFYSFFATCKLNGVNPMQWLTHVLENIRTTPKDKLEGLLPQNFEG